MYQAFFGFKEKPFSLLPDPAFLFPSKKHRTALAMLEYGIMHQAGFTVISGDIGTGKTTLIRHLLNNLERDVTVGLITNAHAGFGELLEWVLLAYDIKCESHSKVARYRAFVDFMIQEYARGHRTVLIVDEAQNLSADTLEELRMLSNINADKDQVIQVILVGQPELRNQLRRPELVQFAQRIAVDFHLEPLEADETIAYIRHRIHVAGGADDLFETAACEAVHRYSGGIPRLINLLCDTALVYAYAEERQRINAALVTEVAKDKARGGLFPGLSEDSLADSPVSADAIDTADNDIPTINDAVGKTT